MPLRSGPTSQSRGPRPSCSDGSQSHLLSSPRPRLAKVTATPAGALTPSRPKVFTVLSTRYTLNVFQFSRSLGTRVTAHKAEATSSQLSAVAFRALPTPVTPGAQEPLLIPQLEGFSSKEPARHSAGTAGAFSRGGRAPSVWAVMTPGVPGCARASPFQGRGSRNAGGRPSTERGSGVGDAGPARDGRPLLRGED